VHHKDWNVDLAAQSAVLAEWNPGDIILDQLDQYEVKPDLAPKSVPLLLDCVTKIGYYS